MQPRIIRQLVQSHLTELAGNQGDITNETLLIRNGEYCGHRYHADAMSAIWFCEEGEIKIYGPNDGVIRAIKASDEGERRVA